MDRPAPSTHLLLAHPGRECGARLRIALVQAGFAVDWVQHPDEVAHRLHARPCDGSLVSEALHGGDPQALQRTVRELAARGVTVILGSAHTSADDRIRLLEAGADDCVPDALEAREIAVRMQALLRRSRHARSAAVELAHGPLRVDVRSRRATWHGRAVALTPTQYRVLEALLRARGGVLSRAALEEGLHGGDGAGRSNAVEVHVHHLRRKLGRHLIRTVQGIGYQLATEAQLAAEAARTPHAQRAPRGGGG